MISPLFSNIYLHYVLDKCVQSWRTSKASGEVIIVRYADDFVMVFQYRGEAERFLEELKKRFAEHGLEIHGEKTRLIEFGRFAEANRAARGDGRPETFDFLGFTHRCWRTRENNCFTIRRKTITKRLRAKIKEVRKELLRRREEPVPIVGKWLRSVVQGHFNYFAVRGNMKTLEVFRRELNKAWFFALRRRSHKAKTLTWDRMNRLIKTWIPKPKLIHPFPSQRLHVNYSR